MFEDCVERFRHNFVEGHTNIEKTAFYGLGKQTKEIVGAFPSFPVIGLLDGYREEGELYGQKILSLASLAGQDVRIIILARKASEKIIYNRIRAFCREQGISVYSMDGSLLGQKEAQDTDAWTIDQDYFRRSRKELMDRIEACDTVSFDIFDTLLTRSVLQPEQIFRMVGTRNGMTPDFAHMRMRAELELSREGSPAISDIYHWLGERMSIASDKLAQLQKDEIVVEHLVLRPRQAMVEAFREAIALGKNVYLISDMYLPGSDLEGILRENGIVGYEGLFVSCDWGTDKAGGLYDIYKKHSADGKRLHIGDSEEADGKAAAACGIEAYLIRRPQEMAEMTALGRALMQIEGVAGWQGMICTGLFNDPFALFGCRGKLQTSPDALGYGILGPILAGYVHWLFRRLSEETDIMLFIARDGFLVKQIYDLWKGKKGAEGLPEAVYLMTSRTFSVYASVRDREDISYAAGLSFDGSAEEMLCRRFHLGKQDILPRRDGEEDADYIMRHSACILARAAAARSGYREYLSRFGLERRKAGIFDFVSTGTCQMCLEKILGISMEGYYFERIRDSDEGKRALVIQDFVHTYEPDYESDNYFLLESWIKALHPSIDHVSAEGSVVYCGRHKSMEQQNYIRQIQKGALDFCKDYLEAAGSMEEEGEGIERLAVSMLPYVKEEFICIEAEQLTVYDAFSSREIRI